VMSTREKAPASKGSRRESRYSDVVVERVTDVERMSGKGVGVWLLVRISKRQ
jgi:hypothetical protein